MRRYEARCWFSLVCSAGDTQLSTAAVFAPPSPSVETRQLRVPSAVCKHIPGTFCTALVLYRVFASITSALCCLYTYLVHYVYCCRGVQQQQYDNATAVIQRVPVIYMPVTNQKQVKLVGMRYILHAIILLLYERVPHINTTFTPHTGQ